MANKYKRMVYLETLYTYMNNNKHTKKILLLLKMEEMFFYSEFEAI